MASTPRRFGFLLMGSTRRDWYLVGGSSPGSNPTARPVGTAIPRWIGSTSIPPATACSILESVASEVPSSVRHPVLAGMKAT